MASRRKTFSKFGPLHIPSFNWNNLYDRTSAMSCLVQGVYTMERDRQHNLYSPAKDWCEHVGFTLEQQLVDADRSIYGAVFRKCYNYQNTLNSTVAPQYVIAFRGTIRKPETLACDGEQIIRCFLENLLEGERYRQGFQVIKNFVASHGNAAVWIAGHSIGAGLALQAGKDMAMSGFPVEAYIFNPPISLIPLESLFESEKLKRVLRVAGDIIKVGVVMALSPDEVHKDDLHKKLASWIPYLFVNESDPICKEYIGVFHHRVEMAEQGLGCIERFAARHSLRGMLFGGGDISSSHSSGQYLHFLPSAFVMKNTIESDFQKNHGIDQWWDPTLQHHSTCASYMEPL